MTRVKVTRSHAYCHVAFQRGEQFLLGPTVCLLYGPLKWVKSYFFRICNIFFVRVWRHVMPRGETSWLLLFDPFYDFHGVSLFIGKLFFFKRKNDNYVLLD